MKAGVVAKMFADAGANGRMPDDAMNECPVDVVEWCVQMDQLLA